jgi:hypothetical protein
MAVEQGGVRAVVARWVVPVVIARLVRGLRIQSGWGWHPLGGVSPRLDTTTSLSSYGVATVGLVCHPVVLVGVSFEFGVGSWGWGWGSVSDRLV